VDDDVEEEDVSEDANDEYQQGSVDDLAAAALHLIDSAYPLLAHEVIYEGSNKQDEPNSTEDPLVVSVKSIGKGRGKANGRETQQYKYQRTKATQRGHNSWRRY